MTKYTVTAQSMMDGRRISKSVHAGSEAQVLRMVSAELEAASFYVIHIVEGA